jgi:hypothetical protein
MWSDLISLITRMSHQSGTLAISGTATSATVTIPPQGDTHYQVFVQPQSSGAAAVTSITKTASSFTVTIASAPGVGVSWNYDWVLMR